MIGIRVQLALKLRERLHLRRFIGRIEIGLGAGEAIDTGILLFQGSQHVVERPVFHHQDNDVL